MLCFVVVMQSFIMNSHEVFIHIHQGCFAGTGAIVRLLQYQWSKPDGYGKISQCIATTKHSTAKTVCIFLGIYCISCEMCRLNYNLLIHYMQASFTQTTNVYCGQTCTWTKNRIRQYKRWTFIQIYCLTMESAHNFIVFCFCGYIIK